MASSTSSLIPSDPDKVMVLRRVNPSILTCSTPFLRFGLIKFGGRGTIVKLHSGNLAVFSPVALTERVKSELSSFGNGDIKYIVALDQEHHIFIEPWLKAFPSAQVVAPETLPEYRDKQKYWKVPQDSWTLFKETDKNRLNNVSDEFDREFDREYVHAHANRELVFNHKPTKTLIEADLIFNLPAREQMSKTDISPTSGILTHIFGAMQNTHGDAVWQKRFLWYLLSAGDRKSFNTSMTKINEWDFDTIVPCHGDVIEEGGKGIFQKVMQWHLEAGKKGQ